MFFSSPQVSSPSFWPSVSEFCFLLLQIYASHVTQIGLEVVRPKRTELILSSFIPSLEVYAVVWIKFMEWIPRRLQRKKIWHKFWRSKSSFSGERGGATLVWTKVKGEGKSIFLLVYIGPYYSMYTKRKTLFPSPFTSVLTKVTHPLSPILLPILYVF